MVEADVAEFEYDFNSDAGDWESSTGGLALATEVAPAPVLTFSPQYPDEFEVQIRDTKNGMTLVAAIEVVSPANKDREETRAKLVSKCIGYLQIGVVLVDPVTNRSANLHNLLMVELGGKNAPRLSGPPTYVSSYRPVGEDGDHTLEVWPYPAPVGPSIPSVPLPLRRGPSVMIDLEATYLEALADNGLTAPK